MSSERERIKVLANILSKDAPGVRVGIGDDAAVLQPPPGELVWTVDEQVEGTHFRLEWLTHEDLGWRSVMSSASDLAAMGARPWCALASVVLPKGFSEESFQELVRGQRAACDALAAALVGGNLARGERVSLATTWLGVTTHAMVRGAARLGDGVWLAGDVGLAAAGLASLHSGVHVPVEALLAWRRPSARVVEGLTLVGRATSSIDVSDGLVADLAHVAHASGVRLSLDAAALRASLKPALLAAAAALGKDALGFALAGGEDYALACTSPVEMPGFVRIGSVVEGEGVWLLEEGRERRLLEDGFDHFV